MRKDSLESWALDLLLKGSIGSALLDFKVLENAVDFVGEDFHTTGAGDFEEAGLFDLTWADWEDFDGEAFEV